MSRRFPQGLEKYIPSESIPVLDGWKFAAPFEMNVKRPRSSKLGDHRPPYKGDPHKISVNVDLGPYTFLITLIHEIAHLEVWERHKGKVPPHGKEWKNEFKQLMAPLLEGGKVFPEPVQSTLVKHMRSPKASLYADPHLLKQLHELEGVKEDGAFLEELPDGAVFKLEKGWVMKKGKKLRRRFQCQKVGTRKFYLVHGSARVEPLTEEQAS